MAFWDVCNQGTTCTPWNPMGGNFGVHGARSDYGVPLPVGTPIQAPVNGVVLPQHPGSGWYSVFGRQSFGGEVDILSNVPEYGGLVTVGVIHLDTASVQPGQVVRKGDVIGTSGGQTSGGNWPSSPLYSSGPHVGLQVHQPQSWDALVDPGILMGNLWKGKDSSSIPSQSQLQQAQLSGLGAALQQASNGQGCDWKLWLACATGLNPAACAACNATGGSPNPGSAIGAAASGTFAALFPTLTLWLQDPMRVLKLVGGTILLAIGLIIAFLPDIGAAAVTAAGVPEAAPFVRQSLGRSRGPSGAIRSGLATAGALRGKKRLAREKQSGKTEAEGAQHQEFSRRSTKAAQTRKANKAANISRMAVNQEEKETILKGRNTRYEQSKTARGEPIAGGPAQPAAKPAKIPSRKERRAAEKSKDAAERERLSKRYFSFKRTDLDTEK